MDVSNLYTEIDIGKGLKAVKEWLARYLEGGRPDDAILKLLEMSLGRNDFEFAGQYFLQVKGMAIGKRFVSAYANIYMAEWEETVAKKCTEWPKVYWRYLDDIFGIWESSEQGFRERVEVLNGHHESIRCNGITSRLTF